MIVRQSYEDNNLSTFWVRWVFDFTNFVFINMVCLNIILGIIINTFRELRNRKKEIDKDNSLVCFICSLTRDDVVTC